MISSRLIRIYATSFQIQRIRQDLIKPIKELNKMKMVNEKAVQLLEQLNCKLDTIIGLLENKTIEKIGITDFSDDKQQLAVEVSLKVKNVFERFLYPK